MVEDADAENYGSAHVNDKETALSIDKFYYSSFRNEFDLALLDLIPVIDPARLTPGNTVCYNNLLNIHNVYSEVAYGVIYNVIIAIHTNMPRTRVNSSNISHSYSFNGLLEVW